MNYNSEKITNIFGAFCAEIIFTNKYKTLAHGKILTKKKKN